MQSATQCCPSWIFIAPAVAMTEVSSEPMTTPIIMPMSAHDSHGFPNNVGYDYIQNFHGFPNSNDVGYATSFSTIPPHSWPTSGVWSYVNQEEAPQQLPMKTSFACDGWTTEHEQSEYKQELPAQGDMDTMTTTALASAAITAGILRQRRPQGHSAETYHMNCWSQTQESYASPGASSEMEYAQELANHMLAQLQAKSMEIQTVLAEFEAWSFSNKTTSQAAQIVLKKAPSSDAALLASALRGHVRSALQSKHANFVLQTIIEVMPVSYTSFIVDELKGAAGKISRQQIGCRILCRILEHLSANDLNTLELIDELLSEDLLELCQNEFGSYVARHVLEFGLEQQKLKVVNVIRSDLLRLSQDRFGSHVVEAALRNASQEDQLGMKQQLLLDKLEFVELAGSQFGRHVVKALLSMHGEIRRDAMKVLLPEESRLRSMRYGKSILQHLRAASKCNER
jgi:hypothetical protein